jgi:hypothetical protein
VAREDYGLWHRQSMDPRHNTGRVISSVYPFCINDIRNIYENDLFYIDGKGELQRNPALESPWWIKLVSENDGTRSALVARSISTSTLSECHVYVHRTKPTIGKRRQVRWLVATSHHKVKLTFKNRLCIE